MPGAAKGYHRSDARIDEDVSDRLACGSWLDVSQIEVFVEKGEVRLTGAVPSHDDGKRAEVLD